MKTNDGIFIYNSFMIIIRKYFVTYDQVYLSKNKVVEFIFFKGRWCFDFFLISHHVYNVCIRTSVSVGCTL